MAVGPSRRLACLDLKAAERQICVRVHAKDAWAFLALEALNRLPEDIDLLPLRHAVLLLGPLVLVQLVARRQNSLQSA